jgi:RNA polymerase sigma-70 factor, ECF subfamily
VLGGIPARPGPWFFYVLSRWQAYTARAYQGDSESAGSALSSSADEQKERELVARVREGDREAFGALVKFHLARAVGLAFRVLHHQQDAEDLVQDSFLAALEHIDAFDAERAFWPWLSRIIVNRGLDLAAARSVRVTEALPDDVLDPRESPGDAAERGEFLERFRHELALLPPRRQLLVQLFELDGYSIAEIADLLDSSPATIRWHLHVARQQLRKALLHFRGGGS